MRIALYEPDIAGNVGTLLRLAACWGLGVDLIEPMGFPWGHRALARAALDYVGAADVRRHADWDAFRAEADGRLVLLTTKAEIDLPAVTFRGDDILLLGSESRGVPPPVHEAAALRLRIPMREGMRSLNLALAAAVVTGEAMRQTGWRGLAGTTTDPDTVPTGRSSRRP